MDEPWRAWAPAVVGALVVLALGLAEVHEVVDAGTYYGGTTQTSLVLLVVGAALATALARRAPAGALAVAAAIGLLHVATDTQLLLVEAVFFYVVFAAARWGRVPTVVAAGLAVPGAAALVIFLVADQEYVPLLSLVDLTTLLDATYRFGDTWRVGAAVIAMLVLAAPWLTGLVLRFSDRARASRASQTLAEQQTALALRETDQAREIARLRDEQARLARDVHDVVGHSLAVILAQAESAQFLSDDDPARLKRTMATIAGSARSSLQDVRQVLSGPDGPATTRPLDTLVDGVRAGGHDVVLRELGTVRPLPPELEVTAYRVLQEMLTNAVKHGRRDEPVLVERHWPDDSLSDELRIEVRNSVDPVDPVNAATAASDERGSGLEGMRQRLGAVGGRLDVRRREEQDATSFTATAWIPLGPR